MSKPSDLAEFLTARLDEEERTATEAAKLRRSPWLVDGVAIRSFVYSRPEGRDLQIADTYGVVADHIALHDPARVLREVAAKRARLAAYIAAKAAMPHEDDIGYEFGPGVRVGTFDALEIEVRRDAAIYDGHPDYDPAWALAAA